MGTFILKITNFGDLGAVSPYFKVTMVKFYKKNRLRGIPLLGKFISKIANFGDPRGCKPTF